MIHTLGEDIDARWRFFVSYSGSVPTATELDTFCTSISSAWNTNLKSFAFSDVTLTSVEAIDLSSGTGASGLWTGAIAGTNTGEPLPANAAFIVKFLIDRRYRGGHPKVYLPYLVAESLDSVQEWLSATAAGLVTAFAAFMTDLLTDGWSGAGGMEHVAVSFFHGFTNFLESSGRYRAIPTARSTPVVDIIHGYAANPKVGSQRRRNQQGG